MFEKVLKICLVSNIIENIFISFFFGGGSDPKVIKMTFFEAFPYDFDDENVNIFFKMGFACMVNSFRKMEFEHML